MTGDTAARLRDLAAAVSRHPIEMEGPIDGEWQAHFSFHGDPSVLSDEASGQHVLATISTAPDDYGRALCEYIAGCSPTAVVALVLPNGRTFGEWAAPELVRVFADGVMPPPLLQIEAPKGRR